MMLRPVQQAVIGLRQSVHDMTRMVEAKNRPRPYVGTGPLSQLVSEYQAATVAPGAASRTP